MRKLLLNSLILFVTTNLVITAGMASAAGSATLRFGTIAGSISRGSSFTISVIENSGSVNINTVEANLLFDESKLQLTAKNCNAAIFDVTAPGTGNGITCGSTSPRSGSQQVANFTFKAIGDGPFSLGFAHTSSIWESSETADNDVWDQNPSTVTSAVATPAAQPAVKKTVTPAAATVAQAPAAPAAEQVKAEETAKTEEQPVTTTDSQPAATENDSVSVWAYLATFLAATALAAGIVYRDNLKKWAGQLKASFGGKTAPLAVAATASASKAKSAKKAPAKKKPAARKK